MLLCDYNNTTEIQEITISERGNSDYLAHFLGNRLLLMLALMSMAEANLCCFHHLSIFLFPNSFILRQQV